MRVGSGLVPRAKRQTLDDRERRFVKGVVEGKSLTQAAKDASYSKSTAEKKSYAILHRPLVRSELTKALERIGVTLEQIVRPIADALKANKSYVTNDGLMVESQVPDHKIRLGASRIAIALLGGIPKVGEATPTAHGLNLFIAVDHGQDRNVEMPPRLMKDMTPPPLAVDSSVPGASRRDPRL
jgi:hypothetical protein